eukprot:COSAG06_NODE_4273_length_4410_cov_5.289754_8_plen_94_part_00
MRRIGHTHARTGTRTYALMEETTELLTAAVFFFVLHALSCRGQVLRSVGYRCRLWAYGCAVGASNQGAVSSRTDPRYRLPFLCVRSVCAHVPR